MYSLSLILRALLKIEIEFGGNGLEVRKRLEELARKIDDKYTLLQLLRKDQNSSDEANRVNRQLSYPLDASEEASQERAQRVGHLLQVLPVG